MSKSFQSRELYDFGGFRLDTGERALTRHGQVVPLTPKAFETLVVLVRSSGRVVEKDQLLKEVWPDTFVEEGILAVNVAAIRKALSEGEEGRSYIETIPRRGYRFIGEVQAVRMLSESGPVANEPGKQNTSLATRWVLAAGSLAMVVLAGFGWYISRPRSTSIPPPSSPIPLTSYPGTELSPSFSPDGSQVAFSWDGERQDNFDIYVKLVDRSEAVRLTSDPARDSSPAWSPDGRHIAFVREGAIFLIPPLGGAERKVADVQAHDIAWTRDGKSLVVSSGKFFKRRLILLSVDTGNVKELTTAALGEEPVLGDEAPVVSPDGLKLVFVRQTTSGFAGLYSMPLAGGEPRRLTQFGSTFPGVAWTADGRELVYAGRVGDAMALWRRSVEAPEGSPAKRIEGVESGAFRPVLSHPAGSPARLAYARPVFDTNIWVRETTALSPPAHKLVPSTRPDTHPQFSPDGRRLAFTSERSGSLQIWVANSDGSNPLQLTSLARGFISAPRWSPDGRVIVFTFTQNNNQDIYSVPADGGPLRRVTSAPSREGRPSWSRDGRWIYFYSNRTSRPEIWKIPAEGSEEIQVTTDGGHESFESPDGKLLYYEDYGVKGLRSVATADSPAPREGTVVLSSVRPGYWAVAEKGIYFVELDDKSAAPQVAYYYFNVGTAVSIPPPIKFYDFHTRKITQIGVIEKGVIRGYPGFSVTWDGRYMAWSQVDQGESDLMMIENFR